MTFGPYKAAAFALPLLAASPAFAQDEEPLERDDNYSLTVGAGAAYLPSYEGSDNYIVTPVGIAFGKIAGFSFATRGTTLTIDLVPDSAGSAFEFGLGPAGNVRLDRSSRIKDPRVRALGKIDEAIEIGGFASIGKKGILHQYDKLSVGLQYLTDMSDTHDSHVLTPRITYETPLSTRTYLTFSAEADRVGDGYAATYFGITPAGALASGLAPYGLDGGWKNMRFSLLGAQALTGDLRNPALSMFAGLSYSRLLGDFKRSPIVADAGDADQYLVTIGLAYSF
ncbi:MipA/OmpV family protein [Sphingosinicella rhizophila]|uniref:MipA/OmpV family protein n=1 Tax=Sphingosinicella rhizophila TaxID=3050082 RepID=A0ABU3Q8I0_9SPHN|nr:MipA/OmpV family protein [Sphingosinicella sp. GR2756]MDT9599686.1 MipA/OmpV family protein [Sphingosinicella sp. GR2756]